MKLEIAELTGKTHRNVLRDIKRILEEAEINLLRFEQVYLAGNGQEQPCFNLPRLECDLVVSGYSAKYRMAIIKRWHEPKASKNRANLKALTTDWRELTGKDHKNVLRDIANVLKEAGIGQLKFESSYLSPQNKSLPCFNLPRLECDLVVSGYSVKYRMAIIKRWQEPKASKNRASIGSAIRLTGKSWW